MGDKVNDLYYAALITVGAVGISKLSKKLLGEPLGTPSNVNGTLKLAVAVGGSSLAVKYFEKQGYIPKTPYKV